MSFEDHKEFDLGDKVYCLRTIQGESGNEYVLVGHVVGVDILLPKMGKKGKIVYLVNPDKDATTGEPYLSSEIGICPTENTGLVIQREHNKLVEWSIRPLVKVFGTIRGH